MTSMPICGYVNSYNTSVMMIASLMVAFKVNLKLMIVDEIHTMSIIIKILFLFPYLGTKFYRLFKVYILNRIDDIYLE